MRAAYGAVRASRFVCEVADLAALKTWMSSPVQLEPAVLEPAVAVWGGGAADIAVVGG